MSNDTDPPCKCSVQDVHDYGPCGEDCSSLGELIERSAFDHWCLTAVDPNVPPLDGHSIPLLTTLLHRVCHGDQARFHEALRIMQIAFEAGQN